MVWCVGVSYMALNLIIISGAIPTHNCCPGAGQNIASSVVSSGLPHASTDR